MALKDYSSTIPAGRTIGEITGMLAKAKAKEVTTTFDDSGDATGVAFILDTPLGRQRFALPVNVQAVAKLLDRQLREGRIDRPSRANGEQAQRTAWRLIKDWLAAQLALNEVGMVTLDEVMMPYMLVDKGTILYQAMFEEKRLALPGPKS